MTPPIKGEPRYSDPWLTVWGGDCREVMAGMEPESVHCVVTSPPYWGLRSYGVGADNGELGMESTPAEYVANLVDVFREVRRVLRADGTVWCNLGDSYASGGTGGYSDKSTLAGFTNPTTKGRVQNATPRARSAPDGLKPKDLVGIPWRVAFALQADGWYLRSDIIWSKPNPMPESVTDRPTRSHEYLFLLAKSARYYFDADAVREGDVATGGNGTFAGRQGGARDAVVSGGVGSSTPYQRGGRRNIRSVWNIATQPYPGAHFATFPQALVEPCIKAGSSERGVCAQVACGAPFVRVVERGESDYARLGKRNGSDFDRADSVPGASGQTRTATGVVPSLKAATSETTGWKATCGHHDDCPHPNLAGPCTVPATVLDPFAGSGTVGLVAQRLSRRAVLIDLNPDYLAQQLQRTAQRPLGLVSA